MSARNNGGPAYPTPVATGHPSTVYGKEGMSLRDRFALAALSVIHDARTRGLAVSDTDMAIRCYAIADAMLEAREKRT